jgi:hypothetical protein
MGCRSIPAEDPHGIHVRGVIEEVFRKAVQEKEVGMKKPMAGLVSQGGVDPSFGNS